VFLIRYFFLGLQKDLKTFFEMERRSMLADYVTNVLFELRRIKTELKKKMFDIKLRN